MNPISNSNFSFRHRPLRRVCFPLLGTLAMFLATALPSSAETVTYQYYRWEVVEMHQGGGAIQLSEFEFYHNGTQLNLQASNTGGEEVPSQTGSSGTVLPVEVIGGDRNPTDGEGSIRVVDGETSTKWITGNLTAGGGGQYNYLYFNFTQPVAIDAYRFATGNDSSVYTNRNPISWQLWGSNVPDPGEGNWVLLDRRSQQEPVLEDETYYDTLDIDTATIPFLYDSFSIAANIPDSEFSQNIIVRKDEPVKLIWDTEDLALGYANTRTLHYEGGSINLDDEEYEYLSNSNPYLLTLETTGDQSITLEATQTGRASDSKSVFVRSVEGGSATFRYYRFSTIRTRGSSSALQLAEFSFYHNGDKLNLLSKTPAEADPQTTGSNGTNDNVVEVQVTNPGGSNPATAREGAVRLVDGRDTYEGENGTNYASKFYDSNRAPIQFEFDVATSIDSYHFRTGNDAPDRDPIQWILEGSEDGENWTLIDNITSFNYPVSTVRFADTQIFPLPGASLDENIPSTSPATWTGASNQDYNNELNWDTGFIPYASDEIIIPSGTVVRNGNLDRGALSTLSGEAALTVNGRFLNGSGAEALFQMEGGALTVNGNYFIVGYNQTGTFHQTGGAITANLDRGFFLSDLSGATGILRLSGGTLETTMTGSDFHVELGKASTADQLLVDGGTVSFKGTATNYFYLHQGSILQVDSGSFTASDYRYFSVGRNASDNRSQMILNGGTAVINLPADQAVRAFIVGYIGKGDLAIHGGSLTITSGPAWIGDSGTGEGTSTVSQDGGSFLIDQALVVGRQGPGSFDLAGGVVEALSLELPREDSTVSLNGGSLATGFIRGGESAGGTLAFNGTEITVSPVEGETTFLTGLAAAHIGGNGLRLTVPADEVSIQQELISDPALAGGKDGGLTKRGAGNLAIAAPTSYTGNTVVEAGVLRLSSASLADDSDVSLSATATLDLGFTGTDTIRSLILGGSPAAVGVWGAEGSGAQYESGRITGTGLLQVTSSDVSESAYEQWATNAGLSGSDALPGADPDQDGVVNLLEFALGGNPSSSALRGGYQAVASEGGAVLLASVRSGASFTGSGPLVAQIDGIRYEVQGSYDLVDWTSATVEELATPPAHDGTEPPAGWEYRAFRVTGEIPNGKAFLRLTVSESP